MVTFHAVKQAIYGLYLTNSYGLRLSRTKDPIEKKRLRKVYSSKQLEALNITVKIENEHKLPKQGQYLLVCNHRSVIDPPLIETALADTNIYGLWVSKKELYNSFFFGLFVRNAGSILLDRDQGKMSGFFAEIKSGVKQGASIFIFPEGTRNKTEMPLVTFKEGSRIIAMKNRLPILPLYIRTNADKVLKNALKDKSLNQQVDIEIGDILDYRQKGDLEEAYRKTFGI